MKRYNEKKWRNEKERRDSLLLKTVDTEVTEAADDRVLNFKISTETPDSYDDVVKAEGWDLERFLKNPVVLWAHSHYQPPIGKAIEVGVKGTDLVASAQFADGETYAFADTVYRLLKGGFLRATSVGFFPQEWTYDEERGGYNFIKQELFEFSVVPVPANPDALSMALKSGEIDCEPLKAWAEETLDMWTPDESVALWVPKAQIEDVYRSLTPKVETMTVSDQFDGTEAVVIEEAMEDITTTVVEIDGEPVEEIKEIKFDIETTTGTEPEEDSEVEALKDTVDELNDTVENLRAQLDQLVAQNAEKKEIEDEDSGDLSEVIDLTFDSHEVESEIDLALLDLDVDVEDLHGIIKDVMERELMNRTGKLPKEV